MKPFFKSIIKKSKTFASNIKSNVAANADDIARSAAKRQKNTIKKSMKEFADDFHKNNIGNINTELVDNDAAKFASKLVKQAEGLGVDSDGLQSIHKAASQGKTAGQWRSANNMVNKDVDYSSFDSAFGEMSDAIGKTETGGKYRKILKDNDDVYQSLKNASSDDIVYSGDRANKMNADKKKEFAKRKDQAKTANESFDNDAEWKKLTEEGSFEYKDPYQSVNEKYSGDNYADMKDNLRNQYSEDYKNKRADIDNRRKAYNKETDGDYEAFKSKLDAELDDLTNSTNDKKSSIKDTIANNKKLEEDKIYNDILNKTGEKVRSGTRIDEMNKGLGQVGSSAIRGKEYFWDGATNDQKIARIGTAVGGAAAGAIGLRYLSGGNLKYNADGEKDIAGIPFI